MLKLSKFATQKNPKKAKKNATSLFLKWPKNKIVSKNVKMLQKVHKRAKMCTHINHTKKNYVSA